MKIIQHTETLVYYDGAQVFEARDPVGGYYIGVMVDSLDAADRYVVAGVSQKRLKKFRSGSLDLRTLLVEAAQGVWYLTETDDDFGKPLILDGFLLCQPFPSLHWRRPGLSLKLISCRTKAFCYANPFLPCTEADIGIFLYRQLRVNDFDPALVGTSTLTSRAPST